ADAQSLRVLQMKPLGQHLGLLLGIVLQLRGQNCSDLHDAKLARSILNGKRPVDIGVLTLDGRSDHNFLLIEVVTESKFSRSHPRYLFLVKLEKFFVSQFIIETKFHFPWMVASCFCLSL